MRKRTSHKLKMQENIASMSLTILIDTFQLLCNEITPVQIMHVHMWISHKCEFGKGR